MDTLTDEQADALLDAPITLSDGTQLTLDDAMSAFILDPLYQAVSDTVDAQERAGTVCFCRNCRSCLNYEDAKWDYIFGLYEAVRAKRYGRRVQAA